MIKYPVQIDDSTSLPPINDNSILGVNFNLLRDSVLAIEGELGVTPSSVYSTVRARLDLLETSLNNLLLFSLSSDLSGSIVFPKVVGLQGRPLTTQTPNLNDVIAWNGIAWAYRTVVDSGISIVGATQGSVIYYNGSSWVQLSPGSSGQYLKTQGVGANPQWSTISGIGSTFLDNVFRIQDNSDNSKQLAFEVSGISVGTTRTITVPNANITIDDISGTRIPTDNTVSTFKIQNDAVTFAKIQNIATDRLVGRDASGSGDLEEISLTNGLTFTGSGSIGIIPNGVALSYLPELSGFRLLGNPLSGVDEVIQIPLNSTLEFNSGNLQRAAISGDVTIAAGSNSSTVTDLTISGESNGDVLYFNGTNWVRNSNVKILNSDLVLTNNASPVNTTNNCKLYSNTIANRTLPFVYADGYTYPLQGSFYRQPVCYIIAAGNNVSGFGIQTNAVGTVSNSGMGLTTSTPMGRLRRITFNSSASAGNFSALRAGFSLFFPGNGSGSGGFYFNTRFGAGDPATVSGARQFCGIINSTSAPTNVEPNTLTNCIGLAQLSTDATQYYIVYGGSAAQTNIPTGVPIYNGSVSQLNGVPIDFTIYSKPGDNCIFYYEIVNLSNGNKTTGTLFGTPGTTVPGNTTDLTWSLWRCNNATALQCNIIISTVYVDAYL